MSAATPTPGGRTGASIRRTALLLLVLSLLVRAAVFFAVSPLRPAFDEKAYYDRAEAFAAILSATATGRVASPSLLDRAYAEGTWPPLFPAVLGAAMALFGTDEATARQTVLWLSALATPVIFLLTLELAPRRAALFAAALHALHPAFVAYGHYLWSESLFVLLLLLAVHRATLAQQLPPGSRRTAAGALCGFWLGLCTLTRVSGAAYAAVLPVMLWLGLRGRGPRLPCVGALLLVAVATTAPWEAALWKREGEPVLLSTASGYNLLKLNADYTSKAQLRAAIDERAAERGVHPNRAGTELALAAIADDPGRFVERSALRLRRLWNADEFVLRHLLHVIYPPLPGFVAVGVCLVLVGCALGVLYAAGVGIASPGASRADKRLLVILVAAGCVAPAMSIGNTRMGLPLVALLLPLAGLGLSRGPVAGFLASSVGARAAVIAVVTLDLVSIATLDTARDRLEPHDRASSSWYADLPAASGLLNGAGWHSLDCLKLRQMGAASEDRVGLDLGESGYHFREDGSTRIEWDPATGSRIVDVRSSRDAGTPGPLRLRVSSRRLDRQVRLEPIDPARLRRWTPIGLGALELRWCGVRTSHQGRGL